MIIKTKLEMDLARREFTPRVDAVQADTNSRAVEISLYENGIPWEPPEGTTAAVAFLKPDGTRGLYDHLPDGSPAAVCEGNVVTATLAPQALTVSGPVAASVILTNGGSQVATFPFQVEVAYNPGAGALESNDYFRYSTLEELNTAVGSLEDLLTTDKSSLVAAVNEIAQASGSGRVTISEDGYTEIIGLRQLVSGKVVRDGQTITVTTVLEGNETHTDVITLDDADYPVKFVSDGREIPWEWEGF